MGREKCMQWKIQLKNGHREQYVFHHVVSVTLITTALVFSLSFSPEWTALHGNGTKLIKVSFSAVLQRWLESPEEKLCNRLWDFLFFHYLHLPEAVQSPISLLKQCTFLWAFHFLGRKPRGYRKLLCSRDTHSWCEGCGWELKWKAFQVVSMLTGSLAFSKPKETKRMTKTTNKIIRLHTCQ